MGNAFIEVGLTEESKRAIEGWQRAPEKVTEAIREGLGRYMNAVENHLKDKFLSGSDPGTPRGGRLPLALRSGSLRQSIVSRFDGPFEGSVGSRGTLAGAYARAMLGDEATTIVPKKSNHLWVPIGDNAPPKRKYPISPRELMAKTLPNGGAAAVIFRSKAGNLIAAERVGWSRKTKRRAGQSKLKLMFVLKDKVTIQPTEALSKAFSEKAVEGAEFLNRAIESAFDGL